MECMIHVKLIRTSHVIMFILAKKNDSTRGINLIYIMDSYPININYKHKFSRLHNNYTGLK